MLIKDIHYSAYFREGKVRLLTFGRSGEIFHQFQWAKNLGVITSEEKLSHVYSVADVFICPTNEDNLPNTVLEAMSCQTPVIGTRVGGIPDMVTDQEHGWLIEPGDAAGLADLLSSIITNPKLLSGKGEKLDQLCSPSTTLINKPLPMKGYTKVSWPLKSHCYKTPN